MKRLLFVFAFALIASVASAQTPIVIGPSSLLAWEVPNATQAIAQACTYSVSAAGGAFLPVLWPVTCIASVPPATAPTCTVNLLAQTMIAIGSGSIQMTATCGGQTSLPSTPYAYLDLVVPIPANVRFK